MRSGVLVLAMWFGGSGIAPAQEHSAVEGVIQDQITAFLADDFDTAFTYASPMIRNLFRTPDNFGMMVRQGYPMVWRPSSVTFTDREMRGDRVLQRVVITDAQGATHVLLYEMMPAGETWKINGVQLLRTPQVGA